MPPDRHVRAGCKPIWSQQKNNARPGRFNIFLDKKKMYRLKLEPMKKCERTALGLVLRERSAAVAQFECRSACRPAVEPGEATR